MIELHGEGVLAVGLHARGADLRNCSLPRVNLSGADLADSSLVRISAPGARFDRAIADNSRWLSCAMTDASFAGMHAENWAVVECTLSRAAMPGIQMRCAHIRNSTLTGADLTDAYLYRAMITGDPPATMDLQGAKLTNAVLVQAYLAANLSAADLRNVGLAYGRLNQAKLAGADLRGSQLFECSLVKTDFTNACMAGIAPPVLADRCSGLEEALAQCTDADAKALLEQLTLLKTALSRSPRRST